MVNEILFSARFTDAVVFFRQLCEQLGWRLTSHSGNAKFPIEISYKDEIYKKLSTGQLIKLHEVFLRDTSQLFAKVVTGE